MQRPSAHFEDSSVAITTFPNLQTITSKDSLTPDGAKFAKLSGLVGRKKVENTPPC